MRQWFYSDAVGNPGSFGLLALRLVMGAAFMFHGWPKIQNPFGWMGPEAAMPGVLQSLAVLSEFGGGLALILGLLTRLACLGIGGTMVVALATVHFPHGDPFVGKGRCAVVRVIRRLPCVRHPFAAARGRPLFTRRPSVQQAAWNECRTATTATLGRLSRSRRRR